MWDTVSSRFREIELRGDRLESVEHVAPFVAPGRLPMEAAMGDLVDARLPRLGRMPLAHRNQHQGRLAGLFVAGQNRAPLAGRLRNVELDAAAEPGSILTFLFAATQPTDRHTLLAQGREQRLNRPSRGDRTASKIVAHHLIDYANLEARTRARA